MYTIYFSMINQVFVPFEVQKSVFGKIIFDGFLNCTFVET